MRVVINPGHEQIRDKGAPGAAGVPEATVNRHVARALCALSDATVTYEPKRQGIVGLSTLTWALHRNPPDVLISLHCNAAKKHPPCIHEGQVYYWASDPDSERRVCSLGLASAIRDHTEGLMSERVTIRPAPYNRDGKPFTPGILVHTAKVAAVLVEMLFISDIHAALAANRPDWVARTATALDNGIRQWARGL